MLCTATLAPAHRRLYFAGTAGLVVKSGQELPTRLLDHIYVS